jgi:hypothetical protein
VSNTKVVAGASVIEYDGIASSEAIDLNGLIADGTATSITVNPDGSLVAGGVTTAPNQSGRRATIAISANGNSAYSLAFPVTARVAGEDIVVSRFQTDPPLAGGLLVGHHDLAVGATIAIPANLPPGHYVGSFDLTVQNN